MPVQFILSKDLQTENRNLLEIIDQIKSKIPDENKDMHSKIDCIANEAMLRAPADRLLDWKNVAMFNCEFLFPPTEVWQLEIFSIFSTRPVEEIKAIFKELDQSSQRNRLNKYIIAQKP